MSWLSVLPSFSAPVFSLHYRIYFVDSIREARNDVFLSSSHFLVNY